MKTALLVLALALAAAGCSGSNCKPDAGDELRRCRPNDVDAGLDDAGNFDGGSSDCLAGEACVSLLGQPAEKRCLQACNPGCPDGFACGATALGNCTLDHPDAGVVPSEGDGGKPEGGGVGCYTYFLCYPNRC